MVESGWYVESLRTSINLRERAQIPLNVSLANIFTKSLLLQGLFRPIQSKLFLYLFAL